MKTPVLDELIRWTLISRALDAHLRRRTTLTLEQFRILARLTWKPAMAMSALSISLQLPSGTVTCIVDSLEKEGFVIRKRTAKDARLRYVCLTEVGREQLARYESFLGAVEAETARGIPPEAWEVARRTQRTLEANLERVGKLYWTLAGSGGGEARCAEPVEAPAPEPIEDAVEAPEA